MVLILIIGLFLCLVGFFLLFTYGRMIQKGEPITGEICEIDDGSFSMKGGTFHEIWVQYNNRQGETVKVPTVHGFVTILFWKKRKLLKLRKKYLGKQVQGYLKAGKYPKVILRKFMWKNIILSLFSLFLGGSSIVAIIFVS